MSSYWVARRAGITALIVFLAVLPLLLPNSFFFDLAIKAAFSAILCIGLNLLIGYAGQISLGHAGFFGLGAYASAILTWEPRSFGVLAEPISVSPLAAMLAGAVLVGSLAYLIARPVLRLQGHYLAMATLGIGIIISIVLEQEVDLSGGPDGTPVAPLTIFGWKVGRTQLFDLTLSHDLVWYTLVSIALVLTVWLALNLIESPIGRALRSVRDSDIAASVAGVDTTRYKTLAFVISAVLAAIAGSLFAHYEGFVTPQEASFFNSITYVTMVVLGGRASVFGAIVGAAVLTVLPQLVAGFHDYEMMVFGLILILTMIFMPRGIVPTLVAAFGRRSP